MDKQGFGGFLRSDMFFYATRICYNNSCFGKNGEMHILLYFIGSKTVKLAREAEELLMKIGTKGWDWVV